MLPTEMIIGQYYTCKCFGQYFYMFILNNIDTEKEKYYLGPFINSHNFYGTKYNDQNGYLDSSIRQIKLANIEERNHLNTCINKNQYIKPELCKLEPELIDLHIIMENSRKLII